MNQTVIVACRNSSTSKAFLLFGCPLHFAYGGVPDVVPATCDHFKCPLVKYLWEMLFSLLSCRSYSTSLVLYWIIWMSTSSVTLYGHLLFLSWFVNARKPASLSVKCFAIVLLFHQSLGSHFRFFPLQGFICLYLILNGYWLWFHISLEMAENVFQVGIFLTSCPPPCENLSEIFFLCNCDR